MRFSEMFDGARFQVGMGQLNPFRGAGGTAFKELVPILFFFVQAVMPALICGSIAMEKERNTLGTLFVTRLSPMTIVFEKLCSRLIPMFSFLLLTFPVLAFIYSLGGVDTDLLFGTMWLLFIDSVLFASIGLACSSFFSTTVTAFIWSYVLTGLLIVGSQVFTWATGFGIWSMSFNRQPHTYFPTPFFGRGGGAPGDEVSLLARVFQLVLTSVPLMFASVFFIMAARFFLFRRAFTSSSSILLRVLKRIDRFFTDLNDRTTGGVVLVPDHNSLPAFDPIAWRERTKKSLGKARYLFRILLLMEGPTLFICVTAASSGQGVGGLRALLTLMWAIAAIVLLVKSATLISSERTRETLDALLSTPITGREIIQQKVNGISRLMIILSVPILSIHFTLWLMYVDGGGLLKNILAFRNVAAIVPAVLYPILVVATTRTVMYFVVWTSAFLGLRATTQTKSVSAAISGMLGYLALVMFLSAFSFRSQLLLPVNFLRPELSVICNEQILAVMSPAMSGDRPRYDLFLPPPNMFVGVQDDYMFTNSGYYQQKTSINIDQAQTLAVITLIAFASVVFLLRLLTLRQAPRLLGRKDECSIDDYFRRREEPQDLRTEEIMA
jgi:hypothetical protein